MNDKEQFGAFLKAEKERMGMNHSEFARLIGHSRDTYISWYRGINGCEDAKKERILNILKDNEDKQSSKKAFKVFDRMAKKERI